MRKCELVQRKAKRLKSNDDREVVDKVLKFCQEHISKEFSSHFLERDFSVDVKRVFNAVIALFRLLTFYYTSISIFFNLSFPLLYLSCVVDLYPIVVPTNGFTYVTPIVCPLFFDRLCGRICFGIHSSGGSYPETRASRRPGYSL